MMSDSVIDDIKVLSKYRDGRTVIDGDEAALHRLASIGLARMGTDVILNGRKFRLKPTAKATTLGKKVIQAEN